MKPAKLFLYPTATVCLVLAAQARPFDSLRKAFHALGEQSPIGIPFVDKIMPSTPSDQTVSTGVILSDVVGKSQSIAIFSGLTRDIDTIADRLDNAGQNTTILAPENSAMRSLKRKPWEDAQDYETFGEKAYEGSSGEDRAHKNLRRFVEAHVVPQSPWGEGEKVKTLARNELWYESKDGKTKVRFRFPHLLTFPQPRAYRLGLGDGFPRIVVHLFTPSPDPAPRRRSRKHCRESRQRPSLDSCRFPRIIGFIHLGTLDSDHQGVLRNWHMRLTFFDMVFLGAFGPFTLSMTSAKLMFSSTLLSA